MRRSLALSTALHIAVAVFAAGSFGHRMTDLVDIPPAVPVDLVTIDDKTNIKEMKKAEPKKEEPPPPEEKAATPEPEPQRTAALPPEAEPTPEPEPTPESLDVETPPAPEEPADAMPAPEPAPQVDEKAAEEKKEVLAAAPVRKPKPPAPAKKKDAFDASKIAALLNKLPVKEKTPEKAGEEQEIAAGPENVEGVGEANAMTMTEIDALRAQMQRCWSIPAGAADAENLIVRVNIALNPDGSLSRAPEVIGAPLSQSSYYQVAAEAALRAVRLCAPYSLPAEKYSSWREINMTFDPRAMLGGG